jgi:hypothetical protein
VTEEVIILIMIGKRGTSFQRGIDIGKLKGYGFTLLG